MAQDTGEYPPVNGIKHEKQDQIKESAMFPSGIFDYEAEHHHADNFVGGIIEAGSVENEGVKLHAQVYQGKDAHGDVESGKGNIQLES